MITKYQFEQLQELFVRQEQLRLLILDLESTQNSNYCKVIIEGTKNPRELQGIFTYSEVAPLVKPIIDRIIKQKEEIDTEIAAHVLAKETV